MNLLKILPLCRADMNMQRYSNPLAESEELKVRKWIRLFIKNWDTWPQSQTKCHTAYDKDTSLMSRVIADMSLCGGHLSLHTNKWVSFRQLLCLTNNWPLMLRPSCSESNSCDPNIHSDISTEMMGTRRSGIYNVQEHVSYFCITFFV